MDVSSRPKRSIIRPFCVLSCLLLFLIFIATIYYLNDVRIARRDTNTLVATALARSGPQLSLSDLSPERKKMLLAIEDPTFTYHHGVDLSTPGAGMTTLTQGLVKLLYFPEGFHPGIAKIRQTLIARYALNAIVSKDD
jgi:membrane peptidoglycan carboxypeptidase